VDTAETFTPMKKRNPMMYRKANIDPVLLRIVSEINKSAQKPERGFMTSHRWRERWSCNYTTARAYIMRAVKSGILIEKTFRILCKGRLRLVKHYGMNTK
jgi:hypothetical protein